MSSKELVLITGATGHLGFKALLDLLAAGYKARIAVRSVAKEKIVRENSAFKALNVSPDSYEFIITPDITVPGAYDDAIKDVNYVIHIASPLTGGEMSTTEEYQKHFIEPAVNAALSILNVAQREPSMKRVVITSSVIALGAFEDIMRPHGADEWFTAASRTTNYEGPYANNMHAYSASKIRSLSETEFWMKRNNPHFDLVSIHPSFVMGRDELDLTAASTYHGSNSFILTVVQGNDFPNPMPACMVHNDDVARLHVEALNTSTIPAGSYVANGPPSRWEDIPILVNKLFPKAVADGTLPDSGKMVSITSNFDAKKTEETFGWTFQDFESQVQSVVGHYLELIEAEKGIVVA
jgi:nucleoside-diphosphate-sugar epimerase